MPSIPVQPISYGDAKQFLSRIGGDPAPDDWQGQINIIYHIGPGFSNGYVACYLYYNGASKSKETTSKH